MDDRSSYAARRNALLRRVPAITYPTPTVASVSPSTLLPAGGETVTVTGTGFRVRDGGPGNGWLDSIDQVRIGESYLGTSLTVVSETSLTFVSPAVAAGTYTLWLKSQGGDSNHGSVGATVTFRILLETGDDLLMETGDALRTE